MVERGVERRAPAVGAAADLDRFSALFQFAAACRFTEPKLLPGPFSLRRLASAFAALTYETATLAPASVVPSAKVTYAPEPLPSTAFPEEL